MEFKYKMAGMALLLALLVGVNGMLYAQAYNGTPRVTIQNWSGNMIVPPDGTGVEVNTGSTINATRNTDSDFTQLGLIANDGSTNWVRGWDIINMPVAGVATNTAYYTNLSGYPQYVDLSAFLVQFTNQTGATKVSSTVAMECGTSTLSGTAAYTTRLTQPFFTTEVVTNTPGNVEQSTFTPTTSKKLAYLANGVSVICSWYTPYSNGCNGASCEAVTSSARGYNAFVGFPYYYVKTPTST